MADAEGVAEFSHQEFAAAGGDVTSSTRTRRLGTVLFRGGEDESVSRSNRDQCICSSPARGVVADEGPTEIR